VVGNLSEATFAAYQFTFDGTARDVTSTVNLQEQLLLWVAQKTNNSTSLYDWHPGPAAGCRGANQSRQQTFVSQCGNDFDECGSDEPVAILLPNSGVKVTGKANGTIKASGDLLDEDDNWSLAGLTGTATFSN
jgi:hypothetical protein